MGLRPLELFKFFQCEDRLYTSDGDDPGAVSQTSLYVRFWRILLAYDLIQMVQMYVSNCCPLLEVVDRGCLYIFLEWPSITPSESARP